LFDFARTRGFGRARQAAAGRRQAVRQKDALAELLEPGALFACRLDIYRNDDGLGIAPLPHALGQDRVGKEHHTACMPLGAQPVLEDALISAAPDGNVQQLGKSGCIVERHQARSVLGPQKMLPDFEGRFSQMKIEGLQMSAPHLGPAFTMENLQYIVDRQEALIVGHQSKFIGAPSDHILNEAGQLRDLFAVHGLFPMALGRLPMKAGRLTLKEGFAIFRAVVASP
jgi:hypothetical protein